MDNKQIKKKLKSDNSNQPDKGGGTNNKEIEKSVLITDDSSTAVAENNQSQVEVKLLKQLSATRQLGGKGTIRRRRLRHKASLVISSTDASNHKSEQLRSFLNKFDFSDYGQMERVTFINDNGKFTSYDAINMHSNWKNGMFYLNMSKYRQHFLHKGQRMSRSKLEDESMSSIENNNNNDSSSSSLSKGIKIDTAEDLMCTLNYINEQEAIFKQQLNKTDENQIILDKLDGFRTQICEIVGTRDAHTYLNRLIQKNNNNNNSQKSFSSISNRMSNLSSTNLIDLKNFQLENDDEEEIPQLVNDFESVHKQDREVIVPISFEQSEPQEEPFIYVNLIQEQTTTQYNLIETNETKPSEILYKTSITEKTVLVEDDQKEMNENSNDDESSSSTKPILDAILEEDTILSPTSYLEDNEQKLSDAFDFNNKQTTEQQACDDTVMSTIESVTRSIKRKLRKNSKRKSVKLEADTGLVKLKPAESVKTELESEIINNLSTETHQQSPLIKKRKKQKNLQVGVTSKPPLPSIESDSLIPITYKEEQQQQQIEQKQNEKKRKKKSSNNSLLKSQTNSSSLNSLVNSSSSGISLSNSAMQSMSTLPTSSVNSINNVIDDSISETEKPIHHKLKSKQKVKSQTETLSIITKNNNIQDQTSLSTATSGLSLAMSTSISGGLQSWSQFSSLTSINDNTNSNNNNNNDELNEIASMIKLTRPIRPKISKSLTERIEINRKSFEDELIQKTVNSRKISNKFLFHKESNLSTSSSSCANLVIEEEEAAAAAATVAAAAAEIQQKLTAEQEKHHLEQINSIDSHEQLIPHPTSSRKSKKIKKKRKLLLQDTNTLDNTNNNQQQQQQQSVVENIILAATTPDETKLIIAADTSNIFSEKELNLIKTFTSSVSSSSLDETKEIELLKSITNYQIDILETKRKLKQHDDNEEEEDDDDDDDEEDDDDKSKRIEKNKNRLINTGSFGISSSSLESEEILNNNSGKIF
jgi:hypothetical protein